jgi:DNA-binding SARP family transcriptional activator
MEFRILGPLEARSEGQPLPLTGPRQHALLAFLLLHANDLVSTERLVDELWYEPPQRGASAVQTQISRLRKVLGERLDSTGRGYLLRVEPGEFDLHRLRALLAEAGASSSPAERSRLLQEAESLWSGEPLSGLDAPYVAGEAAALDELRYGALEERLAADLDRGLAAELLPELALLVSQRPLRERLRLHQMLALYRAGRQAEALEAYQAARAVLDEELGLEPSTALRELERAILRQDPELDVPRARTAATRPSPSRRRRTTFAAAALVCVLLAGGGTAVVLLHSSGFPSARPPVEAAAPKRPAVVHRVAPHHTRHVPPVHVKTQARAHAVIRNVPHPAETTGLAPTTTTVRPAVIRKTKPLHDTVATTIPATTTTAPPPRRPATISDTFAGTQIDSTIWYQIAAGTGWTLTQDNGYVQFSFAADAAPGGQYNRIGGHLGSQCKFPGDFDARVDFALPTWPARNGVVVSLWGFFNNVGYAAWRQSSPQWGELFGSYTGPGQSGGVQLDDTSGSLRLARHDGLLTAYFMHKGSWDPVTSSRSSGVANVAIGADAGPDFAGQPVVVDFSNFSVKGDDPICPPGSQPSSP